MRTPNWTDKKILTTDNGIDVFIEFEEEGTNAKHHFISECGWSESDYAEIKDFYWFSAKIYATKAGIEIGNSYLGGNCYRNLKDVLGNGTVADLLGGYGPQMVEEALEEANSFIQRMSA